MHAASFESLRRQETRYRIPSISDRYNSRMKQLLRKPLFFAILLSIPLWIVFNNYIVAIMVALLAAFLASMCHALYLMNKKK